MLENYCSNLLESRKKHKLTKYKRMESMTNQLSEKASMRRDLNYKGKKYSKKVVMNKFEIKKKQC